MGLLRISSWTTAYHYKDKVEGNLLGEGRYLGGTLAYIIYIHTYIHRYQMTYNCDIQDTSNESSLLYVLCYYEITLCMCYKQWYCDIHEHALVLHIIFLIRHRTVFGNARPLVQWLLCLIGVFRSDKAYFGVAMHISEWQCIFRIGKTYFGAASHISERQCIFRSSNHISEWQAYFGVAMHISEWQDIFWSGKTYFWAAMHISELQDIFRSCKPYCRVVRHILEWQCIFQSGNAYFSHIWEWQDIFRSGNAYFGGERHISAWQDIFWHGKIYFGAAVHIFRATVHISAWHGFISAP